MSAFDESVVSPSVSDVEELSLSSLDEDEFELESVWMGTAFVGAKPSTSVVSLSTCCVRRPLRRGASGSLSSEEMSSKSASSGELLTVASTAVSSAFGTLSDRGSVMGVDACGRVGCVGGASKCISVGS